MTIQSDKNVIRNYTSGDADQIGSLSPVLKLAFLFNRDLREENIFCVEREGEIIAAGYLEPEGSWDSFEVKSDLPFKKLRIALTIHEEWQHDPEIKQTLFNHLLDRGRAIQEKNGTNKIKLISYIDTSDTAQAQFLVQNKFIVAEHQLFMLADLTKEISAPPIVDGIDIKVWRMESDEEIVKYLEAEASVFGHCWSPNRLRWYRGGPEWNTFTAFDGNEVTGSVMTWGINGSRSATENVFVKPEWRGKGVSKAILLHALTHLKSQGKTEATLTVRGDNAAAIRLYHSLGYEVKGHVLEMARDL